VTKLAVDAMLELRGKISDFRLTGKAFRSCSRTDRIILLGTTEAGLLWAGCPSCHPTNGVKALKYEFSQGLRFPVANFAKFHGAICEIPRHYYPQIAYILWPVGVVVLTDNTSKYKVFIVTCNTKTHYIRPLLIKFMS